MSEPLPFGLVYQQVTHINTAFALEKNLKSQKYTAAVYVDPQSGQMVLDVINDVPTAYMQYGDKGPMIYAEENIIRGQPFRVEYTADYTRSNLNIIRKYVIDPTNALTEVTNILDGYRKHVFCKGLDPVDHTNSNISYSYIFYYNDLLELVPREAVMSIIHKRMTNANTHRLKFTDSSYLIPSSRTDGDSIDVVTAEFNHLTCGRGWAVCFKMTNHITKGYEDVVTARHVGHRVEMAPINHNAVNLDEDYRLMIVNGSDKPNLLGEIYREITENTG